MSLQPEGCHGLLFWQDGAPVPFRYECKVNAKTNVFEHKPAADNVDRLAIRPTLFGSLLGGRFQSLPSKMAQIAWEVIWRDRVDCAIFFTDYVFGVRH